MKRISMTLYITPLQWCITWKVINPMDRETGEMIRTVTRYCWLCFQLEIKKNEQTKD